MKKTFLFIAVLGCLFSCLIAFSEDSGSGNPSDYEWYYNPGNGHYYAEIDDRRINWDSARQFARSLGGYVASINDSEEDEWLYLLMCDIHPREIWIGLYREDGVWKWDSGEPVDYANWNPEGWPGNSAVLHTPDRGWFERPSNDFLPLIVEREGPITNVTPTPTNSQTAHELEWVYNPANGHYYAIAFERVPWNTANSNANSVGGYLATLLDESENDFVNQYVQSYGYSEFWIGLYKDSSWRWVTGEELEYSHWTPGEPTEDGDRGMCRENGWNDSPESFTPQCYVIEKSENVVSPTPTPIEPVEPVWHYNPENHHTYTLIPGLKTIEDVEAKAQELGAYVVSITDKTEETWIQNTFESYHYYAVCIGLVFENAEWRWFSGEPCDYSNFIPRQHHSEFVYAFKYINEENYGNQWSHSEQWAPYNSPTIFERDGNWNPSILEWVYNPENGHYYAIVFEKSTWRYANQAAMELGGYLVTVRSDSEAKWVRNLLFRYGFEETWMGLWKTEDWAWITGEELDYTGWNPGEPSGDGLCGMLRVYGWNDAPQWDTTDCFVVEKDRDLPSPTPTPSGPPEYQWLKNSANGHEYAIVPEIYSWEEGVRKASELGGYIVSITSKEEDDWIAEAFYSMHFRNVYIGMYWDDGQWHWASGEPVVYMNWQQNEPDYGDTHPKKFIFEHEYNYEWSADNNWKNGAPAIIVERESIIPTPTVSQTWFDLEWVYNPDNGHYYAIVFEKSTWRNAYQTAMELGVYLVTIRSDSEAKWVRNLLFRYGFEETWMGLWKTEDWAWITGEELDYTGWNPGEPSGDGLCGMLRVYGWNDAPQWDTTDCFVVEKEGDLPLPTPTPSGPPEYQWMRNPANGHEYAIVPDIYSWEEGVRKANELGGYIVSITSKEEDDWIAETFYPTHYRDAYIGLYWNDGKWEWMSGEPVAYTNWQPNEPNYGSIHPLKYIFEDHYNHEWAADANWKEGAPAIIVERESAYPTPTPQVQPIAEFDLNGDSLDENGFWAGAPVGYTVGDVSFGEIPDGTETNGRGMRIEIAPGEGVFAISNQSAAINGLADISGRMRASLNNISLALIALNDEMDGQYGYSNLLYQEIPVKDYRDAHLIYNAPSGELRVAVQAVNPAYNSQNATVWVDRLSVAPYDMESELSGMEDISLEVDGSFDGGLENLYFNMNDADGSIAPFFQSITDVAIRLMLDPFHRAANVGTKCLNVYDRFPFRLLGWTTVKRDSMPGSGVVGMVVTNGMQNLGVFRLADEIRNANDPEEDYLTVGGDFTVNNPDAPVYVFVQLGGPGANASIVVDDLVIVKSR